MLKILKRLIKVNNPINLRLNKIYRYAKKFYGSTRVRDRYSNNYVIEFNSALGKVKVIIMKFNTAYADIKIRYMNYPDNFVFEISACNDYFDVRPYLNDELSGHDIDLALLELEKYLYNTYGDVDAILHKEEKELKERIKRHKKELKKLEGALN